MTKPPKKPKTVTVRYIDEGEEEQEEAALRGIRSGIAHLKTEQGQAQLKALREREKIEREAEVMKLSKSDELSDGNKHN